MPPRYAYWTILAGGLPTAFRSAEREELLPTFHRLREKHPDAELKYFSQGRLWASPEEARRARADTQREERGRDWRPGGAHRDPRQKFRDEKRKQNQERRQERFERRGKQHAQTDRERAPRDERRPRGDWQQQPPRVKPHGDPARGREARGPKHGRPPGKGQGSDRAWANKSSPPRPRGGRFDRDDRAPKHGHSQGAGNWSDRRPRNQPPREKPHGDPFRQQARPAWRKPPATDGHRDGGSRGYDRAASERPQTRERPPKAHNKTWRERPPRPRWNEGGPRKRDWERNQEPAPHEPPHGPSPTREPRPSESPTPTPPPRPSEPEVPPPGPPERGGRKRPFQGRFRK